MRFGGNSAGSQPGRSRVSAIGLALVLLLGPAACTGSPATLALQPDFAVLTEAGIESVSMRGSLPGATDARSIELIMAGMDRAAPGRVLSMAVDPPFPARRVVWHVNPTGSSGTSRLVVNAFDGSTPYAVEQEAVANDASAAAMASAIEAMSTRLLAAIAARANKTVKAT